MKNWFRLSFFTCLIPAALSLLSAEAAPGLRTYVLDSFARVEEKSGVEGPLSSALSGSGERGSSAARAYADYGVLKVYAEARAARTGDRTGLVHDGAQAEFRDMLTIDAPGKTGTSGSVRVSFLIDGALSCSGGWDGSRESYSSADFSFRANDWTYLEKSHVVYFNGRTEGENFLGQVQNATINFTFGAPIELRLAVEAVASAYTFEGADAVSDLENTVTWEGIVSVNDNSGAEVPNYTATAFSGRDYTKAIKPAAPRLAIERLNPLQFQVSWPTNWAGYKLQSASSLSLPDWSAATETVATVGTNYTATVAVGAGNRFFRLSQ